MKLDREYDLPELPKTVRDALLDLTKIHVTNLIKDYNETLSDSGKFIEYDDTIRLIEKVTEAAKVTVKISAKLDLDVLSTCNVLLGDLYQTSLEGFGLEPEAKEDVVEIYNPRLVQSKDAMAKRIAASNETKNGYLLLGEADEGEGMP